MKQASKQQASVFHKTIKPQYDETLNTELNTIDTSPSLLPTNLLCDLDLLLVPNVVHCNLEDELLHSRMYVRHYCILSICSAAVTIASCQSCRRIEKIHYPCNSGCCVLRQGIKLILNISPPEMIICCD